MLVLDAAQVIGNRLAAWSVLCRRLSWCGVAGARLALQCSQLRFQAGLILAQRLFEHLALLGVHALGLGAEAPSL